MVQRNEPESNNVRPADAPTVTESASKEGAAAALDTTGRPREVGGREGPEPTRYGDWEKNGRCIDF